MKSELRDAVVLVVEDECVITLDIEREFQEARIAVLACGTVKSALGEITSKTQRLDCAVVDMILHGETSFAVIDALEERGIPFVIMSACDKDILPRKHRSRPFVRKPFASSELLCVVVDTLMETEARYL